MLKLDLSDADSSLINGVEMANIKNVDGIDAPPASVTLLSDLDFTTMTSDDWTGESTVSLNGQTWTIGNWWQFHRVWT